MKKAFVVYLVSIFLFFSGAAALAAERKAIVLINKDDQGPTEVDPQRGGIVSYHLVGKSLRVAVRAYGLDPTKTYQLTLNGPGDGGTSNLTDDHLARTAYDTGNFFAGGCINLAGTGVAGDFGGDFPCTDCGEVGACQPEGFFNYEIAIAPDRLGRLRAVNSVALPPGYYLGVKYLVKENQPPFFVILFEQEPLNFLIEL